MRLATGEVLPWCWSVQSQVNLQCQLHFISCQGPGHESFSISRLGKGRWEKMGECELWGHRTPQWEDRVYQSPADWPLDAFLIFKMRP